MSRPTTVHFDAGALKHNLKQVERFAPQQKIIAMVKANAYGCGIEKVIPVLQENVAAFGVTCTDEAAAIRQLSPHSRCILFHGIYSHGELELLQSLRLECVIHHAEQLKWLCQSPQKSTIKVWIKVNTGMNRLGFAIDDVPNVVNQLKSCPWISGDCGLITHLACADEPTDPLNQRQISSFNALRHQYPNFECSIANSAGIIALPESHADYIRPGIMLYGVSPFSHQCGHDLGLKPVIRLTSQIIDIDIYPPHTPIGYQKTWQSNHSARIGVVPIGYGDGYPRHIQSNTYVWVAEKKIPIVGRVSMDLITIDLTTCPEAMPGSEVELWGHHVPIEDVAEKAGTIAYELLCQITPRVTRAK